MTTDEIRTLLWRATPAPWLDELDLRNDLEPNTRLIRQCPEIIEHLLDERDAYRDALECVAGDLDVHIPILPDATFVLRDGGEVRIDEDCLGIEGATLILDYVSGVESYHDGVCEIVDGLEAIAARIAEVLR